MQDMPAHTDSEAVLVLFAARTLLAIAAPRHGSGGRPCSLLRLRGCCTDPNASCSVIPPACMPLDVQIRPGGRVHARSTDSESESYES